MQQASILHVGAAYWANVQVEMSIDGKEQDCWVYSYLQFADTLQ